MYKKRLLVQVNGESVNYTGKLRSPEHNQDFDVLDAKLQLFKDHDNPDKLKLSINGKNILDWFKQKYQEFQKSIGISIQPKQNKGIRR